MGAVQDEAPRWAAAGYDFPNEALRALLSPRPEGRGSGPRNYARDNRIRTAAWVFETYKAGRLGGPVKFPDVCQWIADRMGMELSTVEKIVYRKSAKT